MTQKFNDFFELFRALADGKIVQFDDWKGEKFLRLTKNDIEQTTLLRSGIPIDWESPSHDIFDFAADDYQIFIAPKQSQENLYPPGTYVWMVRENELGFDTWRMSSLSQVYNANSDYQPEHEDAIALDWKSSRDSIRDDRWPDRGDEEPDYWDEAEDDEECDYAKDTCSVCPPHEKSAIKKKKAAAKKPAKTKTQKRKPTKKKTATKMKHDLKAFAKWGKKLQKNLQKKR